MNISEQHDVVYNYIGQRIRERRKALSLNLTELAGMMGFSYQQMQKYEAGISHLSAGKLLMVSKILNVPPSFFYEGIKIERPSNRAGNRGLVQKDRSDPLIIMLVEDNPADILLFKKVMNTLPNKPQVEALYDGESGLEYFKNCTLMNQTIPDLIVMDLTLPKMTGMKFLQALKKNAFTAGIPVVVLTNSVSVKEMREAYEHGAAGFIQKSVDVDEFTQSMETLINYWSKVAALPA